jgi:hypothetical protein
MPDLGQLNLLAWNDKARPILKPALVRRAECDRD